MSLTFNMVGGGGDSARLPREYQEVEYLQSSGTQGFSLGLKLKVGLDFDIDFLWTALTHDTDIIGVEGGTNGFGILINVYTGNVNRMIIQTAGSGGTATSAQTFVANTRYHAIIAAWQTGANAFINGEQWNYVGKTTTTNYNLALFCRNNTDTLANFSSARIYSAKVRDAGILVRDLVPCYRKSDSVAGMYDLVNDTFYTNEGTGTFVVGSDVT